MIARTVAGIIIFSAIYGFSMGSGHSFEFGLRNIVKFPALILITSSVCAVAYFLVSKLITRKLTFGDMQLHSLLTFRDTSLLLASISPVGLFLAWTIEKPDAKSLNEYPLFLGLNVFFIALCGSIALLHRTRDLLERHQLTIKSGLPVVVSWLVISLFVGAQCAWYLRPFCGVSTIPAWQTPFILGRQPDFRGDTSFYEAVYHLIDPQPLEKHYYRAGPSKRQDS